MLLASDTIPDRMVISLKGKSALYKGDLMMLELIANSNWTRPVYVATTVGAENYMNLGDNFISEGLANRISPFTTNAPGAKNFDTEKVYRNMMTRYKFGGLERRGLYIDETVMRMCYTHRRLFAQLALKLVEEKKYSQAMKVLVKAEKVIPEYNVPIDYQSGSVDMAKAYAALGQKAKAVKLYSELFEKSKQYINWYLSLNGSRFEQAQQDCMLQFYIMQEVLSASKSCDMSWTTKHNSILEALLTTYQSKGGQGLNTGAPQGGGQSEE
jgi:tetratricopeptide (TPR) repeat protein